MSNYGVGCATHWTKVLPAKRWCQARDRGRLGL